MEIDTYFNLRGEVRFQIRNKIQNNTNYINSLNKWKKRNQ